MSMSEKATLSADVVEAQRLSADIDIAKRAQEKMRKLAPNVRVGGAFNDPREDIVRRLIPGAVGESEAHPGLKIIGGKGATDQPLWGDVELHSRYLHDGWEPVRDDDGEQVQNLGDKLYKRPIEFTKANMQRSHEQAMQRLRVDEDTDNVLMEAHKKAFGGEHTVTLGTEKVRIGNPTAGG